MAAIVPEGRLVWGIQLPVQSQSRLYVEPWELEAGPDAVAQVARAAELAGAFYVAVCDHVAIPNELAASMGDVWYDTVATLGWLASQTERVHLMSHVAVLPYRHPLVTAKAFGTLDLLSGGRVILGVGAGHVAREFEVLGVPFERRGRLLDEAIDEIRAAWSTDSIKGTVVAPRPHRGGGPPVWVGGSSPAAIRRAARRGDGWLPQGPPEGGMRAALARIREERRLHLGDDPIDLGAFAEPIHIGEPFDGLADYAATGSPDQIAARLMRFTEMDVSHVQLRFPARSAAEQCEQLERFGAEVWPLVVGS